jgi:mycofactocin precursor
MSKLYRCFIVGTTVAEQEIHALHRSMQTINEKEKNMENEKCTVENNEEPRILEEIQVEELAIDGICGVY